MKKLRHFQFPYYLTPLVFLLVLVAAFGPFLPLLGFYWDDWVMILVNRLQGSSGLWSYYVSDQPLAAWTHTLLRPVLGESPFKWQVFGFLLRWLTVIAMWWCFSGLWPRSRRQVTFAALLFAVYPVFTQQAVAVTYSLYWLQYNFFFFSLGLMVRAQQSSQHYRVLTVLAVAASLVQLTMTGYFAGVELVRPVVLWLVLGRGTGAAGQGKGSAFRLGRTVRRYLPYLLVLLVYAAWRFYLMPLSGVNWFERLAQGPLAALQALLTVVSTDLLAIFVTSWAPVLDFRLALTLSSFTIGALAAGAAVAVALAIGLPRICFDDSESTDESGWILQAFGLGVLFTLAGALQAWAIGGRIVDDFYANRYALPGMFGASLAVIALLEWLAAARLKKTVLLSVMIGLLVVFHLQTGKLYRNLWAQQLDLYWQLHWRIPDIEAPTALIFEEEPVENQGMLAISAAVNLLYHQAGGAQQTSVAAYSLRPDYDNYLPDLEALNFQTVHPALTFNSAPPDTLLVYYDRGLANCLWVVGPQDAGDPGLPDLTSRLLAVSNLDRIKPRPVNGHAPPPEIFGSEPDGVWCYYFQKADLARQFGDWEGVADLADEALAHGFAPDRLSTQATHEWLPFIEGYARTGRWDAARDLTLLAAEVRYRQYDDYLCAVWSEMDASTPAGDDKSAALQAITGTLSCQP